MLRLKRLECPFSFVGFHPWSWTPLGNTYSLLYPPSLVASASAAVHVSYDTISADCDIRTCPPAWRIKASLQRQFMQTFIHSINSFTWLACGSCETLVVQVTLS